MLVCSWLIATTGTLASAGEPSAGGLSTGEPSAEDLIALAPVFSNGDPRCQGIDVCGTMAVADGVAPLKFRVSYRAPDQHALVIRDGADDTPLLWAVDRKVIAYEPIRPAVLYSTGPRTEFILYANDERIWCSLGIASSKDKPSGMCVSVKGLFSGPSQGDEVVKTGDGTYRLTRVKNEGLSVVAHVDTNRLQPYTKVELRAGHKNSIFLSLYKIAVGEPPGDEAFATPTKEQLAAKLTVRECLDDEFAESIKCIMLLLRSL